MPPTEVWQVQLNVVAQQEVAPGTDPIAVSIANLEALAAQTGKQYSVTGQGSKRVYNVGDFAPASKAGATQQTDGSTTTLVEAVWDWNNQAAPPNAGQVRTDSRDWVGATVVYVDDHNKAGTAMAVLAEVGTGDLLRIAHNTDPSRYALYQCTGASPIASHYEYPVRYLEGAGTLPNSGTSCLVTITTEVPPGIEYAQVIQQPSGELNLQFADGTTIPMPPEYMPW
jgi:hypothetical protein